MAPSRSPKVIKLHVPRHNALRIGNKLNAEVQVIAKKKKLRVDTYQPHPELAQAVESASEWNSLLMTARAERGPQWDVGTQLFHADKHSDLYYDSTPLLEVVKKQLEEENPEPVHEHSQQLHAHTPMLSHQQQLSQVYGQSVRHQTPLRNNPGDFHGMGGMPPMSGPHAVNAQAQMNFNPGPFPGTPGMNMGRPSMPNTPFNALPPGQFFNGDPTAGGSPMRGPMGAMNMNMNVGAPGVGNPGVGMPGMIPRGMPPPGMNMSPEIRRMRSMVDEFPMH